MIEEDYVSFKVARVLKEKGFNEKCRLVWILDKANDSQDTNGIYKLSAEYFTVGRSFVDNDDIMSVCKYNGWNEYSKEVFLCPTIQMAVKWLRVVHKIDLCAFPCHYDYCLYGYDCKIYKNKELLCSLAGFKTYEEAMNEALLLVFDKDSKIIQ